MIDVVSDVNYLRGPDTSSEADTPGADDIPGDPLRNNAMTKDESTVEAMEISMLEKGG